MNAALANLSTAAGVVLLLIVFYDVYATIIRATQRPGPLSEILNRSLWFLATRVANRITNRRWRHRLLTTIGPLLMPLLIVLLIGLLATSFALMYLPRIETGFKIDDEAEASRVLQAFYFSGVTLFTIGYGDITPHTGAMRALALFEGATGIAVFSLSITYLLNVYAALESKRAVALRFFHHARQGADVPGFIAQHFARGQFYGLTEDLRDASDAFYQLLESHLEHPVINYFHPLEVYKGMPRTLFIVLETTTILQACLDNEYLESENHPDVLTADESARYVLEESVIALKLDKLANQPFESEAETVARRRRSFARAMHTLRRAKIKIAADAELAFKEYCEKREVWERELFWYADFLGYDWNEVTGDSDLSEAMDEEVVERHEKVVND